MPKPSSGLRVLGFQSIVFLPLINESRNNTINTKKQTLAIVADIPAIPPKPNIAAMIAITKKVIVQRNIYIRF